MAFATATSSDDSARTGSASERRRAAIETRIMALSFPKGNAARFLALGRGGEYRRGCAIEAARDAAFATLVAGSEAIAHALELLRGLAGARRRDDVHRRARRSGCPPHRPPCSCKATGRRVYFSRCLLTELPIPSSS